MQRSIQCLDFAQLLSRKVDQEKRKKPYRASGKNNDTNNSSFKINNMLNVQKEKDLTIPSKT